MQLKDITEEHIKDIADSPAILGRGVSYYKTGQVKSLSAEGERIAAKVRGSYGTYDVEIWIEKGELKADCDCPYEGDGCKHIVAVLYKWLRQKGGGQGGKIPSARKEEGLQAGLSRFSDEELRGMLLALCRGHADVRRDVLLAISRKSDDSTAIKSVILDQIRDTLGTRDEFIDYQDSFMVVKRLRKIRNAVLETKAETRSELLREMATRCHKAYEHCDDSSGNMGDFIIDCLKDLGKSLREQDLPFEEKRRILTENLDLLEKEDYGLEDGYISLVLELPSTAKDFAFLIKELKLRMDRQKGEYGQEMYQDMLTEAYGRAGMDPEYLASLEQNAEQHGDYLPLARFWSKRGNAKKAVETAERGLSEKGQSVDTRFSLYAFLEEELGQQDDADRLLRVLVSHFREMPSLALYKTIKTLCSKRGDWDSIRPGLLEGINHPEIVEIHLLEGNPEEALEVAMKTEWMPDRLMDRVGEALLKDHPEKSLRVYHLLVKRSIAGGGRESYRIAALYAKKAKGIYLAMGKERAWDKYISALRAANKRKRSLIEELSRL